VLSMKTLLAAVLLGATFTTLLAAQTFRVVHPFTDVPNGLSPAVPLLMDGAAGNLYGTTAYGGIGKLGAGTIFKLSPSGQLIVLYKFTGLQDGSLPFSDLVRDGAGNLYGTTFEGGGCSVHSYGCGVVYKLNLSNVEAVLHTFSGKPDGAYPEGGVVLDPAGNLYGTTAEGGNRCSLDPLGCGTIFRIDPSGHETVLHRFTGGMDGASPAGDLLRDESGNLYGTAAFGGSSNFGVVYKLTPQGKLIVLHSFLGDPDGVRPLAGLIRDASGNMYGTTYYGGSGGWGAVFEISSAGTESVLYSFCSHTECGSASNEGTFPEGALVRDAAGNLYGTASGGGAIGQGTVFKIDPSGNETPLYTFLSGADGGVPTAGLLLGENGILYGTTKYRGTNFNFGGSVFAIKP
jgi:uncharacterized repeat protein (TIGR03803 family)